MGASVWIVVNGVVTVDSKLVVCVGEFVWDTVVDCEVVNVTVGVVVVGGVVEIVVVEIVVVSWLEVVTGAEVVWLDVVVKMVEAVVVNS